MTVTMRDVAALAGVSVKTVSRVVNLEPHTRADVVRRVRDAITELGWVPNGSARTLRTGRTRLLAVGVSELRRPQDAMLAEALVEEITRHGFQAALEPTHAEPVRNRELLAAQGRIFDGIVMIGHPGPDLIDALDPTAAVVVVDRRGEVPVDCVTPDEVEATSLIARHLEVMRRRRPVILAAEVPNDGVATLMNSLAPAGHRSEIPFLSGLVTRADGAAAAIDALRTWPDRDAVVCASDEVALGALAGLANAGVSVPDRVGVIGFGNLDDGRYTTPTLTTVDPQPARLARTAVELLVDRLAGRGPAGARRVVSPVELVRRESTMGRGTA